MSAPYILGIDLGSSSIGWSAMDCKPADDGPPEITAIRRCGVRIFQAGVEGDIEQGKDASRAVKRRQARAQRRQLMRRARKQRKIYGLLAGAGLLPKVEKDAGPTGYLDAIEQVDARLRPLVITGAGEERHRQEQVFPYLLRAHCVEGTVDPEMLGRAVYHLAQRRGFKSNRKMGQVIEIKPEAATEDGAQVEGKKKKESEDKDLGPVKEGIKMLAEEMGDRTLGQYFSSVDPEQARIRRRWTHRDMYEAEFDRIRKTQEAHHVMDGIWWEKVRDALFFQRPLKSASHLIGRCPLEKASDGRFIRRVAPMALDAAQKFRYLQKVNDLSYKGPDGLECRPTLEQRESLIAKLEEGDVTFNAMRKMWGFDVLTKEAMARDGVEGKKKKGESEAEKKERETVVADYQYRFNLEVGGDEKIPGNRTAQKLRSAFGERWERLPEEEKETIICDCLDGGLDDNQLAERGRKRYGLTPEKAKELVSARFKLEDSRARYSRRALKKLVLRLRDGTALATILKEDYPRTQKIEIEEQLPPVIKAIPDMFVRIPLGRDKDGKRQYTTMPRNPAVVRAMSELRRVVNAVVAQYGKPEMIRLEMVRDLKKSKKQREAITKRNNENKKDREWAVAELAKSKIHQPSREDIEKMLLFRECGGCCPYTGHQITRAQLVGPNACVDVEHIIPFSLCLDNTFLNKTLCFAEENRNVKGQKTPWQTYHGDAQRYHEIIGRVKRFHGSGVRAKLEKFQMTDDDLPDSDDFSDSQLCDTAYSSRLAREYLGRLFGSDHMGVVDEGGAKKKMRVQVSPGRVTAYLRREWGMNGILDGDGIKTRKDHRHHAVDAIAIALTGPKQVKILADAAKAAERVRRERFEQVFEQISTPWPGFLDDAKAQVGKVLVSSRVDRQLAGPLHKETNYSLRRDSVSGAKINEDGGGKQWRHSRSDVDLKKITDKTIESIVDSAVRERVKAAKAGDVAEFQDVYGRSIFLAYLKAKDGRKIPIRKVRTRDVVSTVMVGGACDTEKRHVEPGSNHHMVVLVKADAAVEDREAIDWDNITADDLAWHVVSRWEATRRKGCGEAIVQVPEGWRLLFTLTGGEFVEANIDGDRGLYRVTGVSDGEVAMAWHSDARDSTERIKNGGRFRWKSCGGMLKSQPTKVTLDPLGNLRHARD